MISVFATLCSTSGGAGPLGGRTAPVTQGCSAGRLWLWPQTVTCCPSLSSGAGAQWSGSWEPVAQLQSGRGGPGSGRRRGLAVPRGLSGTLATPTWPPPGPGLLSAAWGLGSKGGLAGGSCRASVTQPPKPQVVPAGGEIGPASQETAPDSRRGSMSPLTA